MSTSSKRPAPSSPSPSATAKRAKQLPSDFFAGGGGAAEDDLDAEWAAFEADVVAETHLPTSFASASISGVPTTSTAGSATISAPPMAANAQPNILQNDDLPEDVVDEKEEAQERLLEEFEEMGVLEERVQRLKERREALRITMRANREETRLEVGKDRPGTATQPEEESDEEDEEEEDEEDDFFKR
jgi:zinc finger protein 830